MRRKRKTYHFQYGLAILFFLFVITGITTGLQGEQKQEVVQKLSQEEQRKQKTEQKIKEKKIIRVLIMDNGYQNIVHPKVILSIGGKKEEISPDDKRFDGDESICFDAGKQLITIESLERGYGTPSYAGTLELYSTAEGIVIINELPVEQYLRAVVPSEMPASYELEALKAQAVCARSYAYRQMEKYAYPEYEAHVNDSTDYQVYGNSKTQESTNQAVQETNGEAVYYNGKLVTTYYYSTSCGKTTDVQAWGTKPSDKNKYLQSVKVKGKQGYYEKNLPWYRWKAYLPVETVSNLVGINTGKDVGEITDIEVTERGAGDIALEIKITGKKGTVTVETENKIRTALGGRGYQIELNDGTMTDSRTLLPSAFFSVEKKEGRFVLEGGGFGHGIGMSQNGANEMAKSGKDYKEILTMFYQDVEIR